MTHRCKDITLPQTSFAGGNQLKYTWLGHIINRIKSFRYPFNRIFFIFDTFWNLAFKALVWWNVLVDIESFLVFCRWCWSSWRNQAVHERPQTRNNRFTDRFVLFKVLTERPTAPYVGSGASYFQEPLKPLFLDFGWARVLKHYNIKAGLHVPSTSQFLWAAPLIFLMLLVNSTIGLHWAHF